MAPKKQFCNFCLKSGQQFLWRMCSKFFIKSYIENQPRPLSDLIFMKQQSLLESIKGSHVNILLNRARMKIFNVYLPVAITTRILGFMLRNWQEHHCGVFLILALWLRQSKMLTMDVGMSPIITVYPLSTSYSDELQSFRRKFQHLSFCFTLSTTFEFLQCNSTMLENYSP